MPIDTLITGKKFLGVYQDTAGTMHENWFTIEEIRDWLAIHIYDSPELLINSPVMPVLDDPPAIATSASATYDTDKITFDYITGGVNGNGVNVAARVVVSATISSDTNELIIYGVPYAYAESDALPLVSFEIVQSDTEAPLEITNTDGAIIVTLPADENGDPILISYQTLKEALESEIESGGVLDGIVAAVRPGLSYREEDLTAVSTQRAILFECDTPYFIDDAANGIVTIYLGYTYETDHFEFMGYDDIEALINGVDSGTPSTIVIASDGAASEAEFFRVTLSGGIDGITATAGSMVMSGSTLYFAQTESTPEQTGTWQTIDLSLGETEIALLVGNTPTPSGETLSTALADVYNDVETTDIGLKDIVLKPDTGLNDVVLKPDTGLASRFGDKTLEDFGNKPLADYVFDNIRNSQGVEIKLTKISDGEDDIPETYIGKTLIAPIIIPSPVEDYANVDIGYTIDGATQTFKIWAKDIGASGNRHSINIIDTGISQPPSIDIRCNDPLNNVEITMQLETDENGDLTDSENNRLPWFFKCVTQDPVFSKYLVIDEEPGYADAILRGTGGRIFLTGGTGTTAPLNSSSEEIDAAVANMPQAASTPTLAQTYASGTIAVTQLPTAGETFTIGTETYTFVTTLVDGGGPNEVLISDVSIADQHDGIEYAINADEGYSTYYGAGTVANGYVVAVANAANVTLTAKTIGTTANDVETTTPVGQTNVVFERDHLAGGQDITAAAAGKIIIGSSAIYVAKADCTASENNWVQIPHTPANMTTVTTIDLSGGVDYVVAPTDTIIAVTETDGTDGDIILPAATGSQRTITVSIQHADNAILVIPDGADTINLAASLSVPALSTVTLLDYASGKWMTV